MSEKKPKGIVVVPREHWKPGENPNAKATPAAPVTPEKRPPVESEAPARPYERPKE